MFTSLAHMPLRENAKECDQSLVRYYAAPDPDDRSVTNLMRRETPTSGRGDAGGGGPAYIMLEDIEELHFEFFDEQNNEWRETWNTTSADGQPDRLPTKVRIVGDPARRARQRGDLRDGDTLSTCGTACGSRPGLMER